MESSSNDEIKKIQENIVFHADFPKPGVSFLDLFSILSKPDISVLLFDNLERILVENKVEFDIVAGLETRGFFTGFEIGRRFKKPFFPVRKQGRLPGKVITNAYSTEYSSDVLEIQENAISEGTKVLITDDLLATGGSLASAEKLISKVGGVISGLLVCFEIKQLNGRNNVANSDKVYSLISY